MRSLIALSVLSLALLSCKESSSPRQVSIPLEVKVPLPADATVESLAQDMVDSMDPLVKVISSMEDMPTAEAGAIEIGKIGDQMVHTSKIVSQLEPLSQEATAMLQTEMEAQTAAASQELQRLLIEKSYVLKQKDEAAFGVLTQAMGEFGLKMQDIRPVTEKYFAVTEKAPTDEVIEAIDEVIEEVTK